VSDYVHKRKNELTSDMAKLQLQARKVNDKTKVAHEESVKLKEMVGWSYSQNSSAYRRIKPRAKKTMNNNFMFEVAIWVVIISTIFRVLAKL
jgi:hypothetical protein